MEVLTLLLVFLTVSGHSYVLQPKLTVTQIARLDGGIQAEMRSEQPGDVPLSEEDKGRKREEEGLTPEHMTALETSEYIKRERKIGEFPEDLDPDQMEIKQLQEEQGRRLVAGISLIKETRGGDMLTLIPENVEAKGGNGEREGHMVVQHISPPLSTSSTPLGEEDVTPAIITQSQNPSSSPHNILQSHPPTNPTTIISIELPGKVRSFMDIEELLNEVFKNDLEVNASPNLDDVMAKNVFKSAQQELRTTVVQPKHVAEDIPTAQAPTVKPTEAKSIPKDLNKPNPSPKTNKNDRLVDVAQPMTVKVMEYDSELTVRLNKASPPQPQRTKPSAKPRLTKPIKRDKNRKNKTVNMSERKRKDNKTQKTPQKKKMTPTDFPYFKDNYCPPECACYGRVVQCSDKGVDKIPYGIAYNARYILLMNNHIDSIQLDLLNEYISMEFLVLSNNRLTDGTIEGAFEGVPALKRLYLDRNLLDSVPTDLPGSLEELRLDNNRLSVMSEAAWARCPGLLVLSLSNNSLGNGSGSLPDGVLSPLENLRTLNLDHNQLASVPLGLPLSIKELYLKGNLIEEFYGEAFNGISDLVVLDVSMNRLTNKGLLKDSLVKATCLESLNLEGNQLKQVPRHLPRSLKTLNLEGNLISSIKKAAFSTLKNLEHLGLARNKIFKVAPGAFRTLPVLHQLDLCQNTLRQVPRQLPETLHSVTLNHNRIQSVPRDAFCWGGTSTSLSRLVRVQLKNNLIDMGKLDAQAFRCLRGFQVVHFY